MEYDILMFLYNNPHYNTAADIVRVRKSTKSHVSTSLKKLENKGLIERIQKEDNKKHIEIILTSDTELIVQEGIKVQKQFIHNDSKWFNRRRETNVYQDIFENLQ